MFQYQPREDVLAGPFPRLVAAVAVAFLKGVVEMAKKNSPAVEPENNEGNVNGHNRLDEAAPPPPAGTSLVVPPQPAARPLTRPEEVAGRLARLDMEVQRLLRTSGLVVPSDRTLVPVAGQVHKLLAELSGLTTEASQEAMGLLEETQQRFGSR